MAPRVRAERPNGPLPRGGDDLDETISRAESSLFGAIAELAPSGPWRQAIISLAQWETESLPGSIDELLATRVRYGGADLAALRQKVTGLQEVSGRLELFAVFADIESGENSSSQSVMR